MGKKSLQSEFASFFRCERRAFAQARVVEQRRTPEARMQFLLLYCLLGSCHCLAPFRYRFIDIWALCAWQKKDVQRARALSAMDQGGLNIRRRRRPCHEAAIR